MPRIPSAADVSPVGAGASRLPTVRADARDFGFAIGQGLQDFGEGLAAARPLVEELLRKEEQQAAAEESAEASSHAAAAREASDRAAASWSYDGGTPREEAARADKHFTSLEDGLLKGRSPERQARARKGTAAIREGFVLKVAQTAHNRRVEALGRQTDETLQNLQGQAVRAPAAAEHLANEGTAMLRSQREAGALTAEQFTARNQDFRRKLFSAVAQGQAAADAVADLEAGLYDAVLGDPALKDYLLTQARWRLQSEAAQGQAAAQAAVEAERRGAGQSPLRERTQRLLAAGDMADAELAAERARRARETLEPLRYAPEAVVQAALARLTPPSDETDAAQRLKLQEEVRVQAEAMLRERRSDPAAYVMDQPAVAEAFTAAVRDPALLSDAVAARLAAQAAMELPLDQRRALTRDESAETLVSLDALPPAGRVAALAELGRRYGEQNGAVAAALMQAGLSPVEALLVDATDDPAPWRALTRLVDRPRQSPQATMPQSDLIAEAADRLIAEGRQAATDRLESGRSRTANVSSSELPPLPVAKPAAPAVPRHVVSLTPSGKMQSGFATGNATSAEALQEGLTPEQRRLPFNRALDLRGSKQDQMATIFKLAGVADAPEGYILSGDLLDKAHALTMEAFNIQDLVRREGREGLESFKRRLGDFKAALQMAKGSLDSPPGSSIDQLYKELITTPLKHPKFLTEGELWLAFYALSGAVREGAESQMSLATKAALAGAAVDVAGMAGEALGKLSPVFSIGGAILSLAQESREETTGKLLQEMYQRGLIPRIESLDSSEFWSSKF